jgi:nucleoside phosphorylase
MKALVTFAVEAEFAPWRKHHRFTAVSAAGLRVCSAKLSGTEVVVLFTGIGDSSASVLGLQMPAFVAEHSFDFCISSGLAGALLPQYAAGDILAAKQVRSPNTHVDAGTDSLDCDKGLIAAAEACGARAVASFYTADHIVVTSTEKSKLSVSADAVDMESFGIVKEAYAWGTRPVAIRAISDNSDEDLPVDFNLALTGKGDISVGRIVGQALLHPKSVPSLIRFGKQSQRAAESLADFLDLYIRKLAQLDNAEVMQGKAVPA